jgi:hypothetical protein
MRIDLQISQTLFGKHLSFGCFQYILFLSRQNKNGFFGDFQKHFQNTFEK